MQPFAERTGDGRFRERLQVASRDGKMRRTLLAIAAVLILPTQALATSCLERPKPSREQLSALAGVGEYREAASVALVSLKPSAQPPCFWIKFSRWFRPGAYPHDVCAISMRSQRHELTVIEALKGNPPKHAPAIFNGLYPADTLWVMRRRLEVRRLVWPSQIVSADEDWMVGRSKGHSSTAFRHLGRISDLTLVTEYGVCEDRTIPFLTPYGGAQKYVVFSDSKGRAIHWEPVETRWPDTLVERLRELKAGSEVRETITARAFFASMTVASQYEVRWCGPQGRLRPVDGQRHGKLDKVAEWAWNGGESSECRPGQRYFAIGAARLSERWSDERAWPSIQLVPITDGAIRTADIVTQLKIEGPETIPVAQALAWTD